MTTTDDRVRHHPESLHEFAKEAFRGERAPTALHQDVENFPASSTARHSQPRSPLIIRQSSSRCQMFEHFPRVHLSRRAYSVPNRSVQRRMASCETSIPRAGIVNLRQPRAQ